MTEKRFTLAFDNYDGWAMQDTTGEYSDDEDYFGWLTGQKAVDVMNHFAEENEQLKKQLDETIEGLHKEITASENAFEGLMNENKELRDACKNYDWYKLYNQLLNENEQLKEELKELKIDNKAKDDAIDGLQSMMAHCNLEDLE